MNSFDNIRSMTDDPEILAAVDAAEAKAHKKPGQVSFTWYVHDDKMGEQRDWFEEQVGFTLTEEEWQKLGSPFYEVTLDCELNTETMTVTLLEARL